jgi:hypothetical protein
MALEVFVNKSFGIYAERSWDGLSADVSVPIRERYLKRIHEVMRDKYKLFDKFVIISAELDPAEADRDMEIFQRGKKLRDSFLMEKSSTRTLCPPRMFRAWSESSFVSMSVALETQRWLCGRI